MNRFSVFIFFLFTTISFSQSDDVELWSKINFKKKINKTLSFSFEPGARYNLNEIFFTKQFIDVSIEQLLYSGSLGDWSVELGGRLTKVPNQTLLGNRIYLTSFFSKSGENLKISLRSRLFLEENIGDDVRKYFRNKFTLHYVRSDFFRPFFDTEYLYGLDQNNVNKIRYSLGNSFKMSKKTTIKVFYRTQEFIEEDGDKKRIFGLYLSRKL